MSGSHFRDYHVLLDEQADQIFAMTDPIAERIRKLGASTLKSIGYISRSQRMLDNDAEYVEPARHARRTARTTRRLPRACARLTTPRRAP